MGSLEKPDPPDTRPVSTCCGAIQTRIERHCDRPCIPHCAPSDG